MGRGRQAQEEGDPEEADVCLALAGRRRALIRGKFPLRALQLRGERQRSLPFIRGVRCLGPAKDISQFALGQHSSAYSSCRSSVWPGGKEEAVERKGFPNTCYLPGRTWSAGGSRANQPSPALLGFWKEREKLLPGTLGGAGLREVGGARLTEKGLSGRPWKDGWI